MSRTGLKGALLPSPLGLQQGFQGRTREDAVGYSVQCAHARSGRRCFETLGMEEVEDSHVGSEPTRIQKRRQRPDDGPGHGSEHPEPTATEGTLELM